MNGSIWLESTPGMQFIAKYGMETVKKFVSIGLQENKMAADDDFSPLIMVECSLIEKIFRDTFFERLKEIDEFVLVGLREKPKQREILADALKAISALLADLTELEFCHPETGAKMIFCLV